MKKIFFNKSTDTENRQKIIILSHVTEDKRSITSVTKRFNYRVSSVADVEPVLKSPDVFINKYFDKNVGVERFEFKVCGVFYAGKDRLLNRIDFEHNLEIEIYWKEKVFSPKKSVVLTE